MAGGRSGDRFIRRAHRSVQRRRRVPLRHRHRSTYGQPVVAPADGTVTFADFLGGYGRAVTWITATASPPATATWQTSQSCRANMSIAATPSDTWARAAAAPASPPLRSPHQRHPGKSPQVPSPHGGKRRRILSRQLICVRVRGRPARGFDYDSGPRGAIARDHTSVQAIIETDSRRHWGRKSPEPGHRAVSGRPTVDRDGDTSGLT